MIFSRSIPVHTLKTGHLTNMIGLQQEFLKVLRIRIRIHVFLGLLDPDPLVRGMDPDPSIIKRK
jgi:hypothetical protein